MQSKSIFKMGEVMDDKELLVVFYSRAGQNYKSGEIINLRVGNTEVVATMIASKLGADIFKIEPVRDYPSDYMKCSERARRELDENARPLYKGDVDISSYTKIILGYPIWWGTLPMTVWTFLENHDFSGKTIIPFSTHEGSDLGNSIKVIEKLCPKAEIKMVVPIIGSKVDDCDAEIEQIIKSVNGLKLK